MNNKESNNKLPLKKGENADIVITGLTHEGSGVGRYMDIPVFVPFTAPGDKILAEIIEVKKKYALGSLKKIYTGAQSRRESACPVFTSCGGCSLQQMDYQEQLKWKTDMVRDSLMRIGHLSKFLVSEISGMTCPWHYRNKAAYHVQRRQGKVSLGFYEKGTHRLVINPDAESVACHSSRCLLLDEDLNKASEIIEAVLNKYQVETYNPRLRRGLLKQVVLRKAGATGECMIILVTEAGEWPAEKAVTAELLEHLPATISLIRSIQHRYKGRGEFKLENRLLAGRKYITDYIEDLVFHISSASFYQVNSSQMLVLYNKVLTNAGLTGKETVVDSYSGIGTIALFLARHAGMVYGLEAVPEAVADARENAILNGIENVDFRCGTVERLLPAMATSGIRPDVVVLDPPRRGCAVAVLEATAEMETPRVVYVSCDLGTLARDLSFLVGKGYHIDKVQPVDMFPWTAHVECCCLLTR